jgi:UDP-glucose 4-epimerase
MTVLVTGGAGYIGSHTVRRLVERGEQVVVFDSLENGHRQAIPGVPLVVGSTLDRDALDAMFSANPDIDAIIHFAAFKAAGESMSLPGKYFRNNVDGTLTLLEAAVAAGVRRLVFSSTAAVYGTPDRLPVSEAAALHPENPYGESKLMCERMLAWFDVAFEFKSVSLRYFNAAGAATDGTLGEDWRITLNLVPIVMKAALERGPRLQVFGTDYPTSDGTAIRDYIHVEDLAEAHLLSLDHLRRGGSSDTINLGTGTGSSVKEVLDLTERISGVNVQRDYCSRRQGDPGALFADNTRARQVLGWQPAYGIEAIIESAWKWHSTHPDGFTS